jgi:hypothetical protein
VVVHELAHLKHLNHSKNFWQLVGQFYPEYARVKQWLKAHQHQLELVPAQQLFATTPSADSETFSKN